MTHTDLIGSRPMELDTEQRREERRIEIAARIVACILLAAPVAAYCVARWL